MDIRRVLIVAGTVLLVARMFWPLIARLGLGRLPGDFAFARGNVRFYVPLATSLLLSLVLTLLF